MQRFPKLRDSVHSLCIKAGTRLGLSAILIVFGSSQALQAQTISDGLTVVGPTSLGQTVASGSLAADHFFKVQNTHATGLGIRSQVGVDTNSALAVRNAAGTALTFDVLGNGSVTVAGTAPATVAASKIAMGGGYLRAADSVAVDNGTVRVVMTQGASVGSFGTQSNHDLSLRANNVEAMRITNSGVVGIGTSTPASYPSSSLVVSRPVSNHVYIDAPFTQQSALDLSDATNGTAVVLYRPHSSRDFRVNMATSGDVMSVTQAGNVGIGTTAPTSKLTVNGTSQLAGAVTMRLTLGQTAESTLLMSSENGSMSFLGNTGAGSYNALVQAGDKALIFTNGTVNTGRLVIAPWANSTNGLVMDSAGNVGIGMNAMTNKLSVAGTISAKEIKVTTSGADYVFADDYRLRPLAEVERFITEKKHLPEMMPAAQMQAEGMPVSEVVTKQLAKIEELTLYAIAADKRSQDLGQETAALREENRGLKERLAAIESALGLGGQGK
jgi:hypothetical protein